MTEVYGVGAFLLAGCQIYEMAACCFSEAYEYYKSLHFWF
jgi:hypothetical protein